ncbi:MAG: Lrp/AsnC family transcriptional regulator, partial [Halobacteriaceae archaeon]
TDIALLRAVDSDFDVSLEELARKLDLSKSTVHYRLRKLREKDVIRGISADINPLAIGLEMTAITDVFASYEGNNEELGQLLSEVPGVNQVYHVMGDVDFVIISRVQDRRQLNQLIDEILAIEGVQETASKFVMQESKNTGSVVQNMSDEMQSRVAND